MSQRHGRLGNALLVHLGLQAGERLLSQLPRSAVGALDRLAQVSIATRHRVRPGVDAHLKRTTALTDAPPPTPVTATACKYPSSGGIAAALAERNSDCLSTVTDGDGRILSLWATGRTVRKAADCNLAPFPTWPERAIGTNGMGTALNQGRSVAVRGPEHWCEALHDWYCLSVAIHDTVTRDPIAVLNVSRWEPDVPIDPRVLAERTESIRQPKACPTAGAGRYDWGHPRPVRRRRGRMASPRAIEYPVYPVN